MPRVVSKNSEKTDNPSVNVLQIKDTKAGRVRITLIDYDESNLVEKEITHIQECRVFREKQTVTWINVDGIHKLDIIDDLGRIFDLHPLILESITTKSQRPKIEDFGNYIFVILKMLHYDEKHARVNGEQVSIVLGHNFVLSFQESKGEVFNPIRGWIRNNKGKIRKMGADYLMYSLIDAVVDNYFVILERLGEKIECLEEALVNNPKPETLGIIHRIKKDMIFMRKSVWPLREVIAALERIGSPLIRKSTQLYLKDVYDHTIQVIDTIEESRDMLSGMTDIYLSSLSNRLNEVMKVLTVIATIFIPLTFITGVYGMNFRYMPELESRLGYPGAWLVMLLIAIIMLIYFRRRKWV
ncbi:TPA: magnesium/cobalt transporter CorA [Candidatus Woesearchaeota archaeon]|nr:magnesium/cobalt transporter CorA [Candidatus Woesearchaeota archaeon]